MKIKEARGIVACVASSVGGGEEGSVGSALLPQLPDLVFDTPLPLPLFRRKIH